MYGGIFFVFVNVFQSWFHFNKENWAGNLVNLVDVIIAKVKYVTSAINSFDGHDKESDNVSDEAI